MKSSMKISIRIKSTVFLACLLLLTVSILSFLVLEGIQKNQQQEYEEFLSKQAKVANIYVRQMYLMKNFNDIDVFWDEEGKKLARELNSMIGMKVEIYNMYGKKVAKSMDFDNERDVNEILSYALNGNIAYQIIDETTAYMAPLNDINGQIGVVEFQYSIKNNLDFYNDIKSLFLKIGSVIFILSFIGGYIYFNRLSKGILKLKKDAVNIKMGVYDKIIPLKRNDELGELSEGIYYMSNQIEKNIEGMNEEQNKLRIAVEKLKVLEKQQKTFIGNITHEFKTPLTVIKAYVDLLDIYSDDPTFLRDAKSNISKETTRLYEMVDKILHLASLQKYDFELEIEKIDIKEVIEEICDRMKGKAQKFNITVTTSLKSAFILADKECLMHIFINLIDNAIKYNESKGTILVNNYIKGKEVFIEVTDIGIGIPKESREKIFEPFYTVNKDRSREYGGTGLGLSVVKELVEKQTGKISLLDKNVKGTTFLISFPLL